MWIRFQVWRARRKARLLSQYTGTGYTVIANLGDVHVGRYEAGKRK